MADRDSIVILSYTSNPNHGHYYTQAADEKTEFQVKNMPKLSRGWLLKDRSKYSRVSGSKKYEKWPHKRRKRWIQAEQIWRKWWGN